MAHEIGPGALHLAGYLSIDRQLALVGRCRSLIDSDVPAYVPVVQSPAYQTLLPQAHYHAEADHVVYDPQVWYSGAASTLETDAGAALQSVFSGHLTPAEGYAQFKTALQQLTVQKPPQS